jgi:ribosomal 50S subunit-recycling heat shock protein
MKTTASLNRKVIEAVQTSMRIEGCKPAQSAKTRAQAKALMEQQRVKVSVPGK